MQRRFLLSAGIAAIAAPGLSHAQIPPLRIVVPFTAGGPLDLLTRALASEWARARGGSVIVENKPGANTIIGAQAVANALPDGTTLLMATDSTLSINPLLYSNLPYNPRKDFAPLSLVARATALLMVPAKLAISDAKGLIDHARKHPRQLNFGSWGPGSQSHLNTVAFMQQTGTEMTHIPYKGAGDCVRALMAGEIDVLIAALGTAGQHVSAGNIRALAVMGAERLPALPEVQTMQQAGLGALRTSAWFGLVAPAGTPVPIRAALERELSKIISQPAFVKREIEALSLESVEPGSAAFVETLEEDRRKYPAVLEATQLKLKL